MRVNRSERTISQNLALYSAARDRRLKDIRREMRRLEWLMRWKCLKRWVQRKPQPVYYVVNL